MRSDRWIGVLIWVVVVAIAAFAAVQSYSHIYELGLSHAESGLSARLLPLSIDGLILAASLLMLRQARQDRRGGPLPRVMLVSGVLLTVAANVVYGLRGGIVGAVLAAASPLAFVGIVEAVIGDVRRFARRPSGRHAGAVPAAVPGDAETAAAAAFAASLAGGNPLSQNALTQRFGLTRMQARQVRAEVLGTANGHGAELADLPG